MDELADNRPDLTPLYDAKSLCEEFARLRDYKVKLVKKPYCDSWFVRIKYGKYNLKFFDGAHADSPGRAWRYFAQQLCDPDRYFDPHNFKGWSHFGKCSCPEELAMRMAIYGNIKI